MEAIVLQVLAKSIVSTSLVLLCNCVNIDGDLQESSIINNALIVVEGEGFATRLDCNVHSGMGTRVDSLRNYSVYKIGNFDSDELKDFFVYALQSDNLPCPLIFSSTELADKLSEPRFDPVLLAEEYVPFASSKELIIASIERECLEVTAENVSQRCTGIAERAVVRGSVVVDTRWYLKDGRNTRTDLLVTEYGVFDERGNKL
jgi:hypothetical protein